jgi:hypothetical protein
MIKARVYYADGTTYAGEVFGAPAWGVLCIVERSAEHGRQIVSGGDYYWYEFGHWWAGDFIGMIDYLARPGARKVLIGRMVSNEVWLDTWKRANADPDFPARTAFAIYERVING